MSKIDQKICFINPPIKPDKNLVYKKTRYPIEFDILKKYSNYFYNNRKSYKNVEDIELEDVSDIKEDDLQNFVSCCQNREFIISSSNVFSLYQLSVQYEVPLLIQKTEEYIKENSKTLIFESIFIKIRRKKKQKR